MWILLATYSGLGASYTDIRCSVNEVVGVISSFTFSFNRPIRELTFKIDDYCFELVRRPPTQCVTSDLGSRVTKDQSRRGKQKMSTDKLIDWS